MSHKNKPLKFKNRVITEIRRLNIFPRIFLCFCLFLILSIAILTVLNQKNYTKEIQQNKIQELSTLAQRDFLILNQEKTNFENSVEHLIINPQFIKALEECLIYSVQASYGDRYAQMKIDANQNFIQKSLEVFCRDTKGVYAVSFVNSSILTKLNVAQRVIGTVVTPNTDKLLKSEIYTGAIDADGYPFWRDSTKDVSEIFYEATDDFLGIEGSITLSFQVYEPKVHKPLGVIICCIYPKYFSQVINENSFNNGSNTYIVGNNGMVEGISVELSAPPFPTKSRELYSRIFSQNSGIFQTGSSKGDMLVSFYGNQKFPIYVANLTYNDYIMQPIYRLHRINFVVTLIVILVGAVGFYFVAISIANPVKRLISTMKRVGSGDFTASYKANSHDEIGILCNEFDRMVSDMLELLNRTYASEARQKELELAQKSVQLDALQMQVNPHFMYNTLDMIRWECMNENGGESPASDMIEKFCTLLRMTIKGDNQKDSIADSVAQARVYLDVINFRYTKKIVLEEDFNFDTSQYQIPCLSLQPILENTIKYAFSSENIEKRYIRLAGKKLEDSIILTVEDNGIGISKEKLSEISRKLDEPQKTKDNIGLRNVNQRCKLCYGEGYGIKIESKLSVGTRVTLTIPIDSIK